MKKLKTLFIALALCVPLTVAAQDIEINEKNFPDANFRNYLLSQSYGYDGVLTEAEIKGITNIAVGGKNISSLKGIEYFTALTYLECWGNQLTALDVSKNTALIELYCFSNQLTALDVSKNTALTRLWCYSNQLTALDVSKNTALTYLYCYINQLTALDVSKNTALTALNCGGNQLTALDVSKNTALTRLYCDNNPLTALDVSKNTALTQLFCSRNKIKGAAMDALISSLPQNMTTAPYSFRVYDNTESDEGNVCTKSQVTAVKAKGWTPYYWNGSEWLEYEGSDDESDNDIAIDETHFPDANFRNYLLSQSYGKDGVLTEAEIKGIASINVSEKNISSLKGIEYFTALTELSCNSNYLMALDVSKNTALTYLDCYSNRLTALDVSKNTALTYLDCYKNQLTALDVSKNTALTYLDCSINQLTALDVSKNTALTDLYCYINQLTALDVSKNTALTWLSCSINQLTALDVSKNTALTYLSCSSNQLTALDVSKNTALTWLSCSSNQLTALDVSKNTALTSLQCYRNQLTALDVSKNTALTSLECSSNQLTALDVSKNAALTYLACYNNVIRGKAMDNLISSLPQNTTNDPHKFYIYNNTESDEGNVCTKSQVTVVKAKGWTPLYYNGTEWLEYEGSDDEPTEPISITLPEMETVDVNSTIQLTPTIEPAGVETELTWSSDDESIAKVTSKGLVAGIKPGTAIISVRTSNNLIAECFVIVQDISGIEDVNAGDGNNKTVYTISGQKVTKPVKGGIYIVNGKKVVMK